MSTWQTGSDRAVKITVSWDMTPCSLQERSAPIWKEHPSITSEYYISKDGNLRVNRLTPNDPYMGRTAPLTSKRSILYIYSTNIGTEYFKHPLYSPFLSLQNAICFIMLTCLVPVLFTLHIQNVPKFKKIIPAPKG